jgi:hypothetical protein
MTDADARTRDHDRVQLCVFLQGRTTVTIGKYPFRARQGAIIGKVIDLFVRKILEYECQNPEE